MKTRAIATASFSTLALTLVLASSATRPATAGQKEVSLFTEEEAKELRIQGDHWDPVPRARSAPLGPVVIIRVPAVKRVDGGEIVQTSSPTDLHVEFEENLAPVDMSSLEVKAKKGIFSKSLTDKLTPFIEGTALVVDSLQVPSGKYQIQINVKDLEGQETSLTYRLIVEK